MLGDSIHSLSCMNSRVQSEKMQLELKNEQLLLMKRFLLVFCLFPAFLLMAALLLDPGAQSGHCVFLYFCHSWSASGSGLSKTKRPFPISAEGVWRRVIDP